VLREFFHGAKYTNYPTWFVKVIIPILVPRIIVGND
jgi:hypothetical protein